MAERNRVASKQFLLRMTEEESLILTQKCDELGMTKSEFFRDMILFGYVHEDSVKQKLSVDETRVLLLRISDAIEGICYELNKIGININQLARIANRNKVSDVQDYDYIRNEILQMRAENAKAMELAWEVYDAYVSACDNRGDL